MLFPIAGLCFQDQAAAEDLRQARIEVLAAFGLAKCPKNSKEVVVFVGAPILLPPSAAFEGHMNMKAHLQRSSQSDPTVGDVGASRVDFAPIIRLFRVACVLTAPKGALFQAATLGLQRHRADKDEKHSTLQFSSGSRTTNGLWDPILVSNP